MKKDKDQAARYGSSPNGQKGVQFEDVTIETRDEGFANKAYSSDTDPLVTDSYSGESQEELQAPEGSDDGKETPTGYVKAAGRVIETQYGYHPNRLNRIKFRRESELEEFNFGINFANLKFSKGEQQRLRLYLMQQQQKLNEYVENGNAPIFGFPPICYSPPNELKKDITDGKEAINTLIRHVFNKDNGLASVGTLLDAKKQEDMLLNNL